MKKYLIAKNITFKIINYKHGIPMFTIMAPMTYSLLDYIQIIKIYTNYDNTYEWIFINPDDETKIINSNTNYLDDIKYDEFKNIAPYIYCLYGSIKISIGTRGYSKHYKVYPTIYDAYGRFPTEEEFTKDIEIKDMKTRHLATDLSLFDIEMRTYFKNKYKISDEKETSFFGEQYKLLKK